MRDGDLGRGRGMHAHGRPRQLFIHRRRHTGWNEAGDTATAFGFNVHFFAPSFAPTRIVVATFGAQSDRASDAVGDVVESVGRVVNRVGTAAAGATFQTANLVDAARLV